MVDWDEIRAWDEDSLRACLRDRGRVRAPRDRPGRRRLLELADGTRLLDFTSGLLCANAGHRNERIRDAIVEALDRYGFVWEG